MAAKKHKSLEDRIKELQAKAARQTEITQQRKAIEDAKAKLRILRKKH